MMSVTHLTVWRILKNARSALSGKFVVAGVSAFLSIASGLAYPQAATRGYVIKDSGMLARARMDGEIYWLDNRQVVFIGFKEGDTRLDTHGQVLPKVGLFVWNTASGELRRHAELSSVASLCLSGGYVRFSFERGGQRFVRFGDFGSEREIELDVQAVQDGALAVSPFSCREYNPKLLRGRYGANALPLVESGEYLDRAVRHDPGSMKYFPKDGSDPIALRIPHRNVLTIPRYSEYARKYVFRDIRSTIAVDIPAKFWLLDRSGVVQDLTLPQGLWLAGVVDAMPIHNGWVMTSTAIAFGRRPDASGLYHVGKTAPVRVMRGLPHSFAVSENGCKVAIAIDSDLREKTRPSLRMIDFCSARE